MVAFQCGQHGIVLFGGAFDLLFATAFGNGGDGILAGSGHTGELSSSIAFGNTGDQVSGYAPGAVHFSNAGPTYAGAHGNLDADPLFVDAANGDLRLGPASPCLNVGEVAKALLAQRDRDERSRALDHDLSGAMLPDMGAYERSVYELVVSGKPVGGELLSFTVLGPAGTADLELAADSGFQVLSPLGHLLLGTPRRTLATLQVGQGFQLLVPHATFGGSLAVQATARSMADPSRGNTTQVYRLRVGRPLPATPAPTSVP